MLCTGKQICNYIWAMARLLMVFARIASHIHIGYVPMNVIVWIFVCAVLATCHRSHLNSLAPGDVDKVIIWNFVKLVREQFPVKLLSGEWHRSSLVMSTLVQVMAWCQIYGAIWRYSARKINARRMRNFIQCKIGENIFINCKGS